MKPLINFITIPRSGHHLLIRILEKYFINLDYCEFYHCCGTTPCRYSNNIQKNHDFNLKLQDKKGELYIVQYRDFLESAVSTFKLVIENDFFKKDIHFLNVLKKEGFVFFSDNVISEQLWLNYLDAYLKYYFNFYKKWVLNKNSYLKIDYKQLFENPIDTIERVFLYAFPSEKLNYDKLAQIINSEEISYKNNIENFIFFNKDLFEKTKKRITKLLHC